MLVFAANEKNWLANSWLLTVIKSFEIDKFLKNFSFGSKSSKYICYLLVGS